MPHISLAGKAGRETKGLSMSNSTDSNTGTTGTFKTATGRSAAKRAHWDVRQLVTLAIFCAMGMALSFIQIPIFPPAPWLQYDPSGIVTLITALMFGPAAGFIVQVTAGCPSSS